MSPLDSVFGTLDLSAQINPTIASAVSENLPSLINQTFSALPTEEEAYQIGRRIGEELMKEARAKVPLLGSTDAGGATLTVDGETYNKIMEKLPLELRSVIGKTTLVVPIRGPIKVVVTQERLNQEIKKSVDPILKGIVDVVAEQSEAPIKKLKLTLAGIGIGSAIVGGVIGFFWAKNKYSN